MYNLPNIQRDKSKMKYTEIFSVLKLNGGSPLPTAPNPNSLAPVSDPPSLGVSFTDAFFYNPTIPLPILKYGNLWFESFCPSLLSLACMMEIISACFLMNVQIKEVNLSKFWAQSLEHRIRSISMR